MEVLKSLGMKRAITYPKVTGRGRILEKIQSKTKANHPPESTSKEARNVDEASECKLTKLNEIQSSNWLVGMDIPGKISYF